MNSLVSIEKVKQIFEDLGFDNFSDINEESSFIGKNSQFSSIEIVSFLSSLEEIYSSNGFNIDLFEIFNETSEPPEMTFKQLFKKIATLTNV
tara:strand:+ start:6025 stop:6300 length:276 start_codon:yes stop_codon:yes gene_type:complete